MNAFQRIRILLVDDHVVMRQGLSCLLHGHSDLEVIGEAADGHGALNKARELKPDVILMDISMPRMNGMEATRIIHSELPDIRIIGLSMYDDVETTRAILSAGAVAFLTKSGHSDDLLSTIRGNGRKKPA
jgi:DNA-binding NarL/FixJ family response regulator